MSSWVSDRAPVVVVVVGWERKLGAVVVLNGLLNIRVGIILAYFKPMRRKLLEKRVKQLMHLVRDLICLVIELDPCLLRVHHSLVRVLTPDLDIEIIFEIPDHSEH